MQLKIKRNLRFGQMFKDIQEDFTKRENREAFRTLIQDTTREGDSPVAGKRFKVYAKSYEKIKGKKAPVDMTVSGDMLKSLKVTREKNIIVVKFESVIALYHDTLGIWVGKAKTKKGETNEARKKVIRRLLPKQGTKERFRSDIVQALKEFVQNAIDKATRKQNN